MTKRIRHLATELAVKAVTEDGTFCGPRRGGNIALQVRFTKSMNPLAASMLLTFEHLLSADRKEADKILGHLRAAYRLANKSPETID